MLRDYPTKISDGRCLAAGLHKLLMDIPDSVKQLCAVGAARPFAALNRLLLCRSFMLIVGSDSVPAGKQRNIPSCHQQLVPKPQKPRVFSVIWPFPAKLNMINCLLLFKLGLHLTSISVIDYYIDYLMSHRVTVTDFLFNHLSFFYITSEMH